MSNAILGSPPESVSIVFKEKDIPDDQREEWEEDWKNLTPGERGEYLHLNEYLSVRAKEWMSEMFLEMQKHNDAHHMVEEYEVNYEA